MNVKTVSVTYDRKQNLGDFSSATVGVTLWADVEEGEDLHKCMSDLWQMAKDNVKSQLLPLTPQANQKEQVEYYLGLPVEREE